MSESDSLIECYHDLILTEYKHLADTDFDFNDSSSRLDKENVNKICTRYQVNPQDLISAGLLIQYADSKFRTMHIDLIYRCINLRIASWSPKIPLENVIPEPRVSFLPSYTEIPLTELERLSGLQTNLAKVLIDALEDSGYPGLAFHQHYFLEKLLAGEHKCYLLVSPTASGKSLIFYLAILINVLSRLNEEGTKALVLYPRKALASDQLFKFLRIIYSLNHHLSNKGLRKVTIGLDDGDTPRSARSTVVRRGEVFRGIRCTQEGCKGQLRYQLKRGKASIVCEKCGKLYEEVIATKGDIWSSCPDIVFSNLSALNRRVMMVPSQDIIGPALKWIVLDEAHTYREEVGGHAHWLLKRLDAQFKVLKKGNINFVISSATIPKPVEFASKLIGLKEQIYYESYDDVIKLAKRKFRKLTLDVILAPNPLRSAESLAQELALLLGVWGFTNSKKSVLFVDNVSEVERLYNFVIDTIIRERAEHNDHLDPSITPGVRDISNSFSWRSIARNVSNINPDDLANIFGFHYAELSPEERANVENRFKSQATGLLFSTSTLELGIDIGDIAAIIQYKVPLTSESYTQRIGRAGRSDKVFRVALGILVLTNSPSQVRYVLGNEYLRLIDPEKIDPYIEIPVAWENEEIIRQHLTFSILDVLAFKRRPTYLDYTTEVSENWTRVEDAVTALKELVTAARKHLNEISEYVISMTGDYTVKQVLERELKKIEKKIKISETQLRDLEGQNIEDNLRKLRNAETTITSAVRILQNVQNQIGKTLPLMRLNELEELKQKSGEVEESLRKILSGLEKLKG